MERVCVRVLSMWVFVCFFSSSRNKTATIIFIYRWRSVCCFLFWFDDGEMNSRRRTKKNEKKLIGCLSVPIFPKLAWTDNNSQCHIESSKVSIEDEDCACCFFFLSSRFQTAVYSIGIPMIWDISTRYACSHMNRIDERTREKLRGCSGNMLMRFLFQKWLIIDQRRLIS